MTTTVRDNPTQRRYEIIVDDAIVGHSVYDMDDDHITITHTEIDDAYAGQGLGKTLVTGLLEDVDRRELAVIPLCPFVRKVIAGDPARYLDLVPHDVRQQLDLT